MMNNTHSRRSSAIYAPLSMHGTAPAHEIHQAGDHLPAEQHLAEAQFAPVADINFSPGGISQTVCPSNATHSRVISQQGPSAFNHNQATKMSSHHNQQVAAQGFPLIERPSTDSLVIGAFPNTMDPENHGKCIGMLQDAQAALEDLGMRVKVADQEKPILVDKIKSLLDDKQMLQDRVEGLSRQIEYLMTIPRNKEYLRKFTLFEAEARNFRQDKFTMQQAHAQEIHALEDQKEALVRNLKTTRHCYSEELTRFITALQREREAKEMAHQELSSANAKIEELETALNHERSKVSDLQIYIGHQQQWGQAANSQNSKTVHCMINMLQNVTNSIRAQNEQMAITDRALQGILGNPVDAPPSPRRR